MKQYIPSLSHIYRHNWALPIDDGQDYLHLQSF